MPRRPSATTEHGLLLVLFLFTVPGAANTEFPGARTEPAVARQLVNALRDKGTSYRPRTEHLNADGSPQYTNRLLLEDSPYLIQHAHNPVNWFPWGAEAFARARQEDKPIFLSIGYSTCHWCHVMERESFENVEIARTLNENFIAIKVDRERRPDIDNTYMTAVRLISDHGGWPMSSFLTVDAKTFWGGTYYPPETFAQLLREVSRSWSERRADIEAQAAKIAKDVNRLTGNKRAAQVVDRQVVESALAEIRRRRDTQHGGIGRAPKFPQESIYLFLIDYALRTGDAEIAAWIKFDLDAIADGGIHDHIGGGFHRYSTDARWLIPHFEKMLYNQAQLLRVYTQAYQLLGEARYASVARHIVKFLDREMTSPQGGYYSALDADSPGGEGLFYVWKRHDVETLLEPQLAPIAVDWYNITEHGNFNGANVLHLTHGADAIRGKYHLSRPQLGEHIEEIRETLLNARPARARPLRDEKIVTAWNGMVITALAEASIIFDDPAYLERAIACAEFLLRAHFNENGGLWRSTYSGIGGVRAVAADYAGLSESFIALYDATGDARWLDHAKGLQETLHEMYWDAEDGGYFMSVLAAGDPAMSRPKSLEDGAVPSGNAMALAMLAGLNARTADLVIEKHADELVAAIAGDLLELPSAHTYALRANEIFRHGGSGPARYAARGAVRISTRSEQDVLAIELDIKEGWHIQAHEPLHEDLIGTSVSLRGDQANGQLLNNTVYPRPMIKSLSFRGEELALYEGTVRIEAQFPPIDRQRRGLVSLQLTLQACDDRMCLPPEKIALSTRITPR